MRSTFKKSENERLGDSFFKHILDSLSKKVYLLFLDFSEAEVCTTALPPTLEFQNFEKSKQFHMLFSIS